MPTQTPSAWVTLPLGTENGTGTIFRPGLASLVSGRAGYLVRHKARPREAKNGASPGFPPILNPDKTGQPDTRPSGRDCLAFAGYVFAFVDTRNAAEGIPAL